jgi:hypothetical protein
MDNTKPVVDEEKKTITVYLNGFGPRVYDYSRADPRLWERAKALVLDKAKLKDEVDHTLHLCQKCLENRIIEVYDIFGRKVGRMCLACGWNDVNGAPLPAPVVIPSCSRGNCEG